ncbi:hypothetical protein GQR58_024820 [Nymphon striatum]|nr:hypothetical protein GQR58_024820 [Nymphon striatum]
MIRELPTQCSQEDSIQGPSKKSAAWEAQRSQRTHGNSLSTFEYMGEKTGRLASMEHLTRFTDSGTQNIHEQIICTAAKSLFKVTRSLSQNDQNVTFIRTRPAYDPILMQLHRLLRRTSSSQNHRKVLPCQLSLSNVHESSSCPEGSLAPRALLPRSTLRDEFCRREGLLPKTTARGNNRRKSVFASAVGDCNRWRWEGDTIKIFISASKQDVWQLSNKEINNRERKLSKSQAFSDPGLFRQHMINCLNKAQTMHKQRTNLRQIVGADRARAYQSHWILLDVKTAVFQIQSTIHYINDPRVATDICLQNQCDFDHSIMTYVPGSPNIQETLDSLYRSTRCSYLHCLWQGLNLTAATTAMAAAFLTGRVSVSESLTEVAVWAVRRQSAFRRPKSISNPLISADTLKIVIPCICAKDFGTIIQLNPREWIIDTFELLKVIMHLKKSEPMDLTKYLKLSFYKILSLWQDSVKSSVTFIMDSLRLPLRHNKLERMSIKDSFVRIQFNAANLNLHIPTLEKFIPHHFDPQMRCNMLVERMHLSMPNAFEFKIELKLKMLDLFFKFMGTNHNFLKSSNNTEVRWICLAETVNMIKRWQSSIAIQPSSRRSLKALISAHVSFQGDDLRLRVVMEFVQTINITVEKFSRLRKYYQEV